MPTLRHILRLLVPTYQKTTKPPRSLCEDCRFVTKITQVSDGFHSCLSPLCSACEIGHSTPSKIYIETMNWTLGELYVNKSTMKEGKEVVHTSFWSWDKGLSGTFDQNDHVNRGEICQCRQCRRQCKIFASGVNFSIFTNFLCFFLLKLLKLGEIDGVKFLAWKSGGVIFLTNFMSGPWFGNHFAILHNFCWMQYKPEWLDKCPRIARVHLDGERGVSEIKLDWTLDQVFDLVVLQINPILSGSFSELSRN